jgi:hypothetical protein
MLHTRTAIEYRDGTIVAVVPAAVGVDSIVDKVGDRHARLAAERALDEVLADSFPASDPPSWNPGIARPRPAGHLTREPGPAKDAGRILPMADVIDVSRLAHGDRAFLQALVSMLGAAGIAVLMGVAILVMALPIALAVRGLLEAIGWLFAVAIR